MGRQRVLGAIVLLVLVASAAPALPAGAASTAPAAYVVGLAPDADLHVLLAAGATFATPLSTIDAAVVRATPAVAARMLSLDAVRYVEPSGRATFLTYQNGAQTGATAVQDGQAALPQAYSGAGVTIAVVDTGISGAHQDFAGRVVDRVSFDMLGELGGLGILTEEQRDQYSRAAGLASLGPHQTTGGHGSLVAGVTAGSGVMAAGGVDMRGAAPGALLVDYATCCVSFDLLGDGAIFLLAYDHMIRHQHDDLYPGGIRVSVNSWGFTAGSAYPEEAFREMLGAALDAGIVPVFAAGNSGQGDGDTVLAPQNVMAELIAVGISCPAVDGFDTIAGVSCGEGDLSGLSSHGPMVDLTAPMAGAWIPNVYLPGQVTIGALVVGGTLPDMPPPHDDPAASAQNRMLYSRGAGTSIAAPYIAGVVALMLEAEPTLTPAEVESILLATAQDFGAPGEDDAWGHGEVEALAAVQAALEARAS